MTKQIDYILFIDDTKNAPIELEPITNELIVCRTYRQAIIALDDIYNREPDANVFIILDYHLGKRKNGTGLDLAKYIRSHELPILGYYLCSIYPKGKEVMEEVLVGYDEEESLEAIIERYKPVEKEEEGIKIFAAPEVESAEVQVKTLRSRVCAFFRKLFHRY